MNPMIRKDVSFEAIWLVVSTHLKNISQIGNLPQVGMKIKDFWNHHLVMVDFLGGKCKMSDKVIPTTLHVPLQELFIHQPGRMLSTPR